jgi:hypothetical protein
MKIEKGIPIPKRGSCNKYGESKYSVLVEGDSIFESTYNKAKSTSQMMNWYFNKHKPMFAAMLRKEKNGGRIWVIKREN